MYVYMYSKTCPGSYLCKVGPVGRYRSTGQVDYVPGCHHPTRSECPVQEISLRLLFLGTCTLYYLPLGSFGYVPSKIKKSNKVFCFGREVSK